MAKKILVVDDERHIARLIQINLERAGYEVVTVFSGKDALENVNDEKPDLIVLDEEMPYMDGLEVLQDLRKNPATRDVPIIMLVPKAADRFVFGFQKLYPDVGGLTKPFNPMELVSSVKRTLGDQDESKVNTAIPTPSPDSPTQPVSWWRKIVERWRKIGF